MRIKSIKIKMMKEIRIKKKAIIIKIVLIIKKVKRILNQKK